MHLRELHLFPRALYEQREMDERENLKLDFDSALRKVSRPS